MIRATSYMCSICISYNYNELHLFILVHRTHSSEKLNSTTCNNNCIPLKSTTLMCMLILLYGVYYYDILRYASPNGSLNVYMLYIPIWVRAAIIVTCAYLYIKTIKSNYSADLCCCNYAGVLLIA